MEKIYRMKVFMLLLIGFTNLKPIILEKIDVSGKFYCKKTPLFLIEFSYFIMRILLGKVY